LFDEKKETLVIRSGRFSDRATTRVLQK